MRTVIAFLFSFGALASFAACSSSSSDTAPPPPAPDASTPLDSGADARSDAAASSPPDAAADGDAAMPDGDAAGACTYDAFLNTTKAEGAYAKTENGKLVLGAGGASDYAYTIARVAQKGATGNFDVKVHLDSFTGPQGAFVFLDAECFGIHTQSGAAYGDRFGTPIDIIYPTEDTTTGPIQGYGLRVTRNGNTVTAETTVGGAVYAKSNDVTSATCDVSLYVTLYGKGAPVQAVFDDLVTTGAGLCSDTFDVPRTF